ncbi:hypothetical protein SprV_0100339100 [Sparganum proliferum]
MHQPPDDLNCFLHDRPCFSVTVDHVGALTNVASNPRAALPSITTTSSISAAITAATTNTTTSTIPATDQNARDALSTTNTLTITNFTSSGVSSVQTCPRCDRTFTSHIGLVGRLRIHCTKTGGPMPGAPIHIRRIYLHCLHYPHTFIHRMSLFGHMCIHEGGIHRAIYTHNTFCISTIPDPIISRSPCASTTNNSSTTLTTTETDSAATDLPCPHCHRTFTSRVGLVGRHLVEHRRLCHTLTHLISTYKARQRHPSLHNTIT